MLATILTVFALALTPMKVPSIAELTRSHTDCDVAVDNLLRLSDQERSETADAIRSSVRSMDRDVLVKKCQEDAATHPGVAACIAQVKSLDEMLKCSKPSGVEKKNG